MVTNPRTPTLVLGDEGPIFGCHDDAERRPQEFLRLLPVNVSNPSATMMTHRIDILTGDMPDGSVTFYAGEIRVLREESA